jgi:putative ABC transport system permease protein
VKLYDMIELAGRNLRESGLRNSLTTAGISVGVASLVAMLSLGIGLQKLVTNQLGRSGLFDSIYVTWRQDFRGGNGGGRPPQNTSSNAPAKPLDDAARKSFEQMPQVLEVYSAFGAVGEFRLETAKPSEAHFTVLGGLPASARDSEVFDDFQGKFFSTSDAPEAIIMADFGRLLLDSSSEPLKLDQKLSSEEANRLLGQNIIFRYAERSNDAQPASAQAGDPPVSDTTGFNVVRREQKLKIVGIVTAEPYRGMRQGRTSVFLPIAFAESLNMIQPGDLRNIMRPGQGKTYSALVVRVAKSKDVTQVEEEIKKQGFTAFSIVDASRNIARFFRFLDLFLAIFGSLAVAVAFLGIVNTLVMAILERRREIGIMKALGASDGDVKKIFFVEAGTMGLLGGACGVALGWLIGRAINLGTNIYLQRQDMRPENFWYVSLSLVGWALLFSVVVSLCAGLYPASRAAKLDPVEALRHD